MCSVFSLAIEELERICFDFDDELFDGDLDFFGFESRFDGPVVLARLQLALDEDVSAFDEAVGEFAEAVTVGICYVESNRPLKQRNTLGMLPFLLKPVDLFGGHRCI
jgi:hypothetical protein